MFDSLQFHFQKLHSEFQLDVGNIHFRDVCECRIFHLKEAWFKVGTKQKQRQHGKHVRLLFPSVRWSKSRAVSDGLCV